MVHYIKQRIADIRRGNVPAGYKQIRRLGIYPIEWRKAKIEEFIRFYNEKSLTNNQFPVLTSSRKGLFLQKDYFEDQVTTENNVGYNIIPRGYFTYRSRSDDGSFYFNCNTIIDKGVISCFYPVFSFDKTKVDTDYIFICLNELLKEQIYCEVAGTSQSVLSEKALSGMSLIVPPLAEQKRIAEILGCCDRGIALKKELIAEKKRQKKALMQKLLNPDSGFRLPGFAGEWDIYKLSDCVKIAKDKINPANCDDSYKCVELEHIESGTGKLLGHCSPRGLKSIKTVFHKNDILFGKLRPYLKKIAIAPFCGICCSECIVFNINNDIIPNFLYNRLLLDDFIAASCTASGTKMPRADWRYMKKFLLRIPSLREQQAIAGILSAADREIDLLEQELVLQQQKKKSLMQLLLTGTARV